MKLVIKKGLNIPIAGSPQGALQPLPKPSKIALNLNPFDDIRFRLLAKIGDEVKIGQPLAENKAYPGMMFVSPAAGVISDMRRGNKRRLVDIEIQVASQESYVEIEKISLNSSREMIVEYLMKNGAFAHIRMRPFHILPNPNQIPRDIFVQAIETLPYLPSAELEVEGQEESFQIGLEVLAKLTSGKVHLVHHENSTCKAFLEAKKVERHSITGPHPAGSASVHIHNINPIKSVDDCVWTLSTSDVITIGELINRGRYYTKRIISVAGEGFIEDKRGFFIGRAGYPIGELMEGRLINAPVQLISGDPLTGFKVDMDDYLNFTHTTLSSIPESTKRLPFHFLRLGSNRFTGTRTYLSAFLSKKGKTYPFTTSQHGELRSFIDGRIYRKVMPMRIPPMELVKAVLAENFELAEQLGLLEVAPEDFALTSFICPSKIEMIDIIKQGLREHAKEMGY